MIKRNLKALGENKGTRLRGTKIRIKPTLHKGSTSEGPGNQPVMLRFDSQSRGFYKGGDAKN